jgi:hypothetical protein
VSALLLLVALGAVVVRVLVAAERQPGDPPRTWKEIAEDSRRARLERASAVRHVTWEPLGWRVVRGGLLVSSERPGDVSRRRVFGGEVLRSQCWDRSWDAEEREWFRTRQAEIRRAEWRLH